MIQKPDFPIKIVCTTNEFTYDDIFEEKDFACCGCDKINTCNSAWSFDNLKECSLRK